MSRERMQLDEYQAECQRLMKVVGEARHELQSLVRPAQRLTGEPIPPLVLTAEQWEQVAAADQRYDSAWAALIRLMRQGPTLGT